MREHLEIMGQMVEISKVADELSHLRDNEQRIERGSKLNKMVNNLLALYIVHLNNEEEILLPLTWRYLTDDQIRAIRAKIQMATPPERYSEWMKWMLPSLDVNELIGLFSALKMAAPLQVLEKMMHVAEQNVDKETWKKVKDRAKL